MLAQRLDLVVVGLHLDNGACCGRVCGDDNIALARDCKRSLHGGLLQEMTRRVLSLCRQSVMTKRATDENVPSPGLTRTATTAVWSSSCAVTSVVFPSPTTLFSVDGPVACQRRSILLAVFFHLAPRPRDYIDEQCAFLCLYTTTTAMYSVTCRYTLYHSMSTTTTTRQQQQQKRPVPVPLLLEAFPVPPTHIPPTPTTPNPPPTGPPSLPLPPVPGPSRISEHEQLLLLSSMGRRGSRYSNRDSSSLVSPTSPRHRFSVLSTSSAGKSPSLQVATLPRESTDSARSNSRMSVVPGARGRNTPNLLPPPTAEQLTRMSVSPMPLSDIEDEEGRVRAPPRMPSPVLSRRSLMKKHQGNESISEIDFNDILGAVSDVDDTLFSFNAMPAIPSRSNAASTHTHQVSLADPIDPISRTTHLPSQAGVGNYSYPSSSKHSPINSLTNAKEAGDTVLYTPRKASQPPTDSLPPLHSPAFGINTTPPTPPADAAPVSAKEIHMEIRAARSSSSSHKRALTARNRSRSTTRGAPATVSPSEPLPPLPIANSQDMTLEELGPATAPEKPRSPSPDIVSIISATPRPLRKSTSRPRLRSNTIERRKLGIDPISRRVSEGSRLHMSTPIRRDEGRRLQSDGGALHSELAYLKDDPSLPRKPTVKQRKASDDEDGGSDSSIDIHTPLPYVHSRCLLPVLMWFQTHYGSAGHAFAPFKASSKYGFSRWDTIGREARQHAECSHEWYEKPPSCELLFDTYFSFCRDQVRDHQG